MSDLMEIEANMLRAILRRIQEKLADGEDEQLSLIAKRFLLPRTQEQHTD
ncbi:MAG: hypothetical protein ISR50_20375 [Alphaproteobacteria bacterium]|nr:hypothetical protein [Alphaproteobacteria bacterium]